MKLEKLRKGNFIKTSVIVLVVISVFGVIFINKSKAKYRVTQSIQVVSGEVNYKVPDLNVLALYKQKTEGDTSDGNYESITDVPASGYKVNTDKSYCTIVGNDTQLKDIPMEYKDGRVSISIKKKGTKCYVYLDIYEPTLLDQLKEKVNSTSEGCPAYEETPSITSIEDKKSLLCKGIDDFGDTYYYRGAVTNNWVKLGNTYWRIIRVNGNGSIRLIYSGSGNPATSGTSTQIGTSKYNASYRGEIYVKYMDDNMNNSTTNPKNSNIKQVLDDWYKTNLKSTYESIIDGTAGFCNDADNGSTSSNTQHYKPYDRILINKEPTFKCGTPTTNLFTTSDGTYGNQKLTNPIGLITIDEANFAGGIWGKGNSNNYLCTGQEYWTMSPSECQNGFAHILNISGDARFGIYGAEDAFGVRPVINLKADTQFKDGGDGTSTNPYTVVI